jgi:prophage antirepressor-like protein/Holliday junction resolvase RusA-like endonuclease
MGDDIYMKKQNNLTVFSNDLFGDIRTVVVDEETYFIGKDVAEALGYKNTSEALNKHVDEAHKVQIPKRDLQNCEDVGTKGATLINESGVYSLIFGSKLESAKAFKRWVTSEVLPQLRQIGVVILDNAEDEVIDYQARYGKYRLKKTFMNATDLRAEYERYAVLSKIERDAHRIDNKERIRDTKTIISVIEERMTDIVAENPIELDLTEIVLLKSLLSKVQSDLTILYNKRNSGIKSAQTKKIQQLEEENELLRNQQNIDEFEDLSSFHMIPRHAFTANKMTEVKNGRKVNSYVYKAWMDNLRLSDFLPADMEDVDFTGKLKLYLGFVSIPSMDLDNQVKAIQDALSNYYSFNDNQISKLNAVRLDTVDTYEEGKIYIKISNIDDVFDVDEDDEER